MKVDPLTLPPLNASIRHVFFDTSSILLDVIIYITVQIRMLERMLLGGVPQPAMLTGVR